MLELDARVLSQSKIKCSADSNIHLFVHALRADISFTTVVYICLTNDHKSTCRRLFIANKDVSSMKRILIHFFPVLWVFFTLHLFEGVI